MRKIAEFHGTDRVVRVYWNAEHAEYQCKLYYVCGVYTSRLQLHAPSVYYTDDKQDAIGTARAMLKLAH